MGVHCANVCTANASSVRGFKKLNEYKQTPRTGPKLRGRHPNRLKTPQTFKESMNAFVLKIRKITWINKIYYPGQATPEIFRLEINYFYGLP